jgi:hypothetical protein
MGRHCERKIYFPDSVMVKEGSTGNNMFIVNAGSASLTYKGQHLRKLKSGCHFGASVMLGVHRTYPTSLVAKNMCHVIVIDRNTYGHTLDKYPNPEANQQLRVTEKVEADEQLSKGIAKRRLAMLRVYQLHLNGKDVTDDQSESVDPVENMRNCFRAWQCYSTNTVECRRQRSIARDQYERRSAKWLGKLEEGRARVASRKELERLIKQNVEERGPIKFLPSIRPAPQAPNEQERSPKIEKVLANWPRPRPSPHYKLHFGEHLQEALTAQFDKLAPATEPSAKPAGEGDRMLGDRGESAHDLSGRSILAALSESEFSSGLSADEDADADDPRSRHVGRSNKIRLQGSDGSASVRAGIDGCRR